MTLPIPTDTPYTLSALLGVSLRVLWRERTALLRAMALPLALILLLSLTQQGAPLDGTAIEGEAAAETPQADANWPVALLVLVVDLYAVAVFSVAWYRFLLGYGAPRLWPGLDRDQLRFFWRMLLIYLVPLLPLLPIGKTFVPAPLLVVASLALIYVALRCSLVLPAAAAGVPLSLQRSWRATAGNAVPLFFAPLFGSFVIGAMLAVPSLMVAGFFIPSGDAPPEGFAAFLLWLEFGLVSLVTLAQAAAVLAMAAVKLVPDPQGT